MSRASTPSDGAKFIAGASTKSDNVSKDALSVAFIHINDFESHACEQARLMSLNRFLIADLTTHLGKEWPASFTDVSYDDRGFLVAAFDSRCAAAEGDVLSYMNKFVSPAPAQIH